MEGQIIVKKVTDSFDFVNDQKFDLIMRVTFLLILLPFMFYNCRSSAKSDNRVLNTKYFATDVFMKLPIESLSNSRRIELLNKMRIDSIDDETYMTIDIDSTNNSIFVQSCFIESSTMPCDNYYIKSYQVDSSRFLIVYSKSSNSYADNYQSVFNVYQYDIESKGLSIDTTKRSAFKIQLKDFFIENTPDSILKKYIENVNPIYSFQDSRIFCTVTDRGYGNTLDDESWLKGNTIEILWDGKDFKIVEIYKVK